MREGGSQEERIVEAALVCVARWGVTKTTSDDIAREAGVSRATVYRLFPGGRDALVEAVARAELERFWNAVSARIEAADSLEEMLVGGMVEAGTRLASHAALRSVLTYEPELVLPHLAFDRAGRVLSAAAARAVPHLARFLPPDDADATAEWVARIVLSYASWPAVDVDLTDEASVARLVRTFVLPALLPQAS